MPVQIDVWDRQTTTCPDCGGMRVIYSGAAVRNGQTSAVFWAFLYDHPGNPEVYLDAVYGLEDTQETSEEHVTFGSRTGRVEQHPHIASSLVTGGAQAPDDPRFGKKLTRDQALVHPLLEQFWEVNDAVLQLDEVERLLTAQPPPRRRWRWWR